MDQTARSQLAPILPTLSADTAAIAGELSGGRVDRILDAVRQHLGMEIAFVSKYDGTEREFTHISTNLPIPHKPGLREPKEESFCFHILEGRLPQLIHDAADHELAKSLPITNLLPVGCHLNVPLRFSDGTIYGSFCALSRAADRSITQRDMGVMNAFAALAVECIESEFSGEMENSHIAEKITDLIASRQLTILHQPIHSLATGEPMGVECLARFPDAAVRGPDKWFLEAEAVGMGVELEMFAVRAALATLASLPQGKYASINASPATILSGELHALLTPGMSDRIVIEVTEHTQVADYAGLATALRGLDGKARIAIDDVGAGYAGLRHIVDLAPDILKLDMSLTRDVHIDKARCALSVAMVRFAEEIGATLVAEGIECAEEAEALRKIGVTYGQGYYYARPLPVVRAQRHMLGLAEVDERPTAVAATPVALPDRECA